MNGQTRSNIYPGLLVDIVLKADQPTGKLTRGVVQQLLTSSSFHPRGVKVKLASGQVGRVQHVVQAGEESPSVKKSSPISEMILLSPETTFAQLFEMLEALDPTGKKFRFEKKLDEYFTPYIVDEIFDFQHDATGEAAQTHVLDYFQKKGYDEKKLAEYLSLEFKK